MQKHQVLSEFTANGLAWAMDRDRGLSWLIVDVNNQNLETWFEDEKGNRLDIPMPPGPIWFKARIRAVGI